MPRRFSDRHPLHSLSEINVTPLLDLAFVLLIIFIITTPLLENSVNLVVPTSTEATQSTDPSKVQTINIDKDAKITLNNEPVDPDELETRLQALVAENSELGVVVRPHRDLTVQQFVRVMDILQKAKIGKVGVATRSDEPQ
jgi:biopolymer transport protein ExbD